MSHSRVASRYAYKQNRSVTGLDAQDVGEELERIREVRGELTPPVIVNESEPEAAVLHHVFEWNNDTAAHEYRLYQARNIVNTVTVVHENPTGRTDSMPGFVSVTVAEDDEEALHSNRQYVPTVEAMVDPDLRAQMLNSLRARLRNLRAEHRSFAELNRVWEVIDEECSD